MDVQTLKWMEERVKLGNTLKKEIESCDKVIAMLESPSTNKINIGLRSNDGTLYTGDVFCELPEICNIADIGRGRITDIIRERKKEIERKLLEL